MTEEAKKVIEALNRSIVSGQPLIGDMMRSVYAKRIIDLIESLSAQLKKTEQERDGLNIMLAQALAMLETRTKERDAAVADLKEELRNQSVISLCENCRCKPEGDYVPNDCMDCVNGCNWQWRGAEVTNDAQKGSDAKS